MEWHAFEAEAPELARDVRQLVESPGVCLVGTLRRDGAPRISPCEPYVVRGRFLLGMMPESRKARDLLRDPRLVVHNAHADRSGETGDAKVYGIARDISDDAEWLQRYGDATQSRIDWRPQGPFHLFVVDVTAAALVRFGGDRVVIAWDEHGGLRRLRHPDA